MIDSLIRNLQSDISLLQLYIRQRQSAGFHDAERMIEALTIHMFRALDIGDLENKNQVVVNFPTIDLADDKRNIAVQVTSNATPSKIDKTILGFEKKNDQGISLKDRYTVLYIFGFCKVSKHAVPTYCNLIDPSYLINELYDKADEEKIQDMLDAIRRHHDYTSLHPWEDKPSLEIILNVINRNAIKHIISCEGSIIDMTKGLKEITELIAKGTICGKVRAKSISDFEDQAMIDFLREVMHEISNIQAVVNRSKSDHGDFANISYDDMCKIDSLKRTIAEKSTNIAKLNGIKIEINMCDI